MHFRCHITSEFIQNGGKIGPFLTFDNKNFTLTAAKLPEPMKINQGDLLEYLFQALIESTATSDVTIPQNLVKTGVTKAHF